MGIVTTISLFSISLVVCLLLKLSVVYALIIGYIIFISYGLIKRHNLIILIKKSFEGVLTVKNILLVFILIGMITVGFMSGFFAFYLYFLLLWNLSLGLMEEKNKNVYIKYIK